VNRTRFAALAATALAGSLALAACGGGSSGDSSASGDANLSGAVRIDGSSTVYPLTALAAEDFMGANPGVQVTVASSGTGGGFEKFCRGETDANDASRPIKDEEKAACEAAGIKYGELQVAVDALTVVVNKENTWATCLTVEELNKIWAPDSTVANWSEVRPGFPDVPLQLFGAGTDSGTFDYFTEAIVGESGDSRADYTASEDDNILVVGVSRDRNALGYFGMAYYLENQSRLASVAIDGVTPTVEHVADGTYVPLSRPIFIYVKKTSLESRPEVRAFVEFMLDNATTLVPEVGYVPLPESRYADLMADLL